MLQNMKVQARNIEEEPKLKQENMCVEPSWTYLLENEKIRKYLPLNCKPPTPYCDYKMNQCVGSKKGTLRSAKYQSVVHCVNPRIAYVLKTEKNRRIELYCNPPESRCDFETNTCVEEPEEERYRVPNQCFDQSLAHLLKTAIRDELPLECKPPLPLCDFERNQCVEDPEAVTIPCYDKPLEFLLKTEIRDELPLECKPPLALCDFKRNQCVRKLPVESKEARREENNDPSRYAFEKLHTLCTLLNSCKPPTPYCDYKKERCVEEPEEEIYRVPNQCYEQSLAFLLKSEIRDYLPLECGGYLPVCDFEKNMCVGEYWGSSRPLKGKQGRQKIKKVSSPPVESKEVSEEHINQDNEEDGDYY